MSLLGAYKKKTSYDGYECLQLVDSGGDSFGCGRASGGGGGALGAAALGPKAGPLREEDCSTMDSSGRRHLRLQGLDRVRVGDFKLSQPGLERTRTMEVCSDAEMLFFCLALVPPCLYPHLAFRVNDVQMENKD